MDTELTGFAPFATRMREADLPEIFIASFAHYYAQLVQGADGLISESDIEPVHQLPDSRSFSVEMAEVGQEAMARAAIIKLNGGLGTSMGLRYAKSLLTVKDGMTFLDIIANQALLAHVPLVLMDSFATHEDSMAVLSKYPELNKGLPGGFVQNKEPKVDRETLAPAEWPADPSLEWCPPGHGDLYVSLVTSGMLDRLLEAGYEVAFVSNADNLGAVLEPAILGYFVANDLPFLMEVARRTESDRKGGHLARHKDGGLILRELAQCPAGDLEAFQDIGRYRYFNTNNLWINLRVLKKVLEERDYFLGLPMIRNVKPVDPRDLDSTPVYQLETAMGSAIAVFESAEAIQVPRARFAPVKRTDDLLAIRSDAYVLTDDYRVVLAPERQDSPPVVELDSAHYRLVMDLDTRFPDGPPSLVECDRMRVQGDLRFGTDIRLRGDVCLCNTSAQQRLVPDRLMLSDEEWYAH